MDMKSGMWNIRSNYRTGSMKTVVRELGKHKLDLMGFQEVKWEKSGTERAEDYTFFYGEGNGDHLLGSSILYIKESYQQLGEWSLLVTGCRIKH
jgi:hypothetical protein